MKIGSSLKTKSYLIMAPLVGLFLLLTFAMVHATWQIRGEVAQVENEASDALWSGRLARASDRYRADYWELLSTGKTSEQEQVGEDAAEVEAIIEHFREENEAAGDHADVARLQSFAKEFASAKASVDAAARYLTNTDAAASRHISPGAHHPADVWSQDRDAVSRATSGKHRIRELLDVTACSQNY